MRWFRFKPTPLERILNPGTDDLKRMSPRELAKYKAGWAPNTENWILADAEQRHREAWRSPAGRSFYISLAALVVSLLALITSVLVAIRAA